VLVVRDSWRKRLDEHLPDRLLGIQNKLVEEADDKTRNPGERIGNKTNAIFKKLAAGLLGKVCLKGRREGFPVLPERNNQRAFGDKFALLKRAGRTKMDLRCRRRS